MIRALRRERGWTQFELAVKVGVQPQAVYLWETGRRTPQVAQLRKLGQLFDLCSDEIELEPVQSVERAPRRPRADRGPGEPPPGRDRDHQRVVTARDEHAHTAHHDAHQDHE